MGVLKFKTLVGIRFMRYTAEVLEQKAAAAHGHMVPTGFAACGLAAEQKGVAAGLALAELRS